MGMVACPPQVMRLISGASRWSSRLTTGTTDGPSLAGVRSMLRRPAAARRGAWARWAAAEVASNTMVDGDAAASSQSMPEALASIPASRARARPGDAGSMPTMAATSRTSERSSLAIRSVPMLPVPRIMQGRRPFAPCGENSVRFRSISGTEPVSVSASPSTSLPFCVPERIGPFGPLVVQADLGLDDGQEVHGLAQAEHLLHVAGGLHLPGGHGLGAVHRPLRQLDHRRVVELEVDVGAVAVTGADVDRRSAPW